MALTKTTYLHLLMWKNSQEIGVKQDLPLIVYALVSGYLNTKHEKNWTTSLFTHTF